MVVVDNTVSCHIEITLSLYPEDFERLRATTSDSLTPPFVMPILLQIIGTLLVLLAVADVYLTVLYPRAESSVLSRTVAGSVWRLFRVLARGAKRRDRCLSYAGPTIVVAIVGVWVLLLLIGFALIIWPGLGNGIQSTQGETPRDLITAIYYAGYALSTLGTGDLVPQTATYRSLIVLKSCLGFSVLTLTLSYITSVYGNLTSRNTFALSLHHRTADTADSTELLARLAADNNVNTLHQDISEIARDLIHLLESNNSYPVIFYFRYRQTYYALPRILYLTIDTATLLKTAFEQSRYRSLIASSGAAELWFGSKHLLEELNQTLLPEVRVPSQDRNEFLWREHYYQALKRLQAEGICTVEDPAAGVETYVAMRHEWAPYLAKLTKYMDYEPSQISPTCCSDRY